MLVVHKEIANSILQWKTFLKKMWAHQIWKTVKTVKDWGSSVALPNKVPPDIIKFLYIKFYVALLHIVLDFFYGVEKASCFI